MSKAKKPRSVLKRSLLAAFLALVATAIAGRILLDGRGYSEFEMGELCGQIGFFVALLAGCVTALLTSAANKRDESR